MTTTTTTDKFAGFADRASLTAAITLWCDRMNQLSGPVGIITATHAYARQHRAPARVLARLAEQFNLHQSMLDSCAGHVSILLDAENALQDEDRTRAAVNA